MVVICPNCKGRPVVSPATTFAEMACLMCDGHGVVNTSNSCKCGRPAVRVVGSVKTKVCSSLNCLSLALGVKPKGQTWNGVLNSPVQRPSNTGAPINSMEDEDYSAFWDRMY